MLLRDRASGEALFETHASNEGVTVGGDSMIGALFEAAMADFPKVEPKSHRVSVQIAR